MYGGTSIWEDIKFQIRSGNILMQLIIINVAFFIVINLGFFILNGIVGAGDIATKYLHFFTLPADLFNLVRRPWTLITHMFSHQDFFHILFNMLILYWFGRILSEYLGQRKILPLYVLGALSGALFYILFYNISQGLGDPSQAEALGASAGVMAIVLATATLLPDYQIYLILIGPVKLKWIAAILVVMDLVGINGLNAGGSLAHLGGALFGFLFIRQLHKGLDWSIWFNNFADKVTGLFQTNKRPRVSYRNTGGTSGRTKSTASVSKSRQERLDEILDKISRSGYEGLSKEEKEFLFKVSKDNE